MSEQPIHPSIPAAPSLAELRAQLEAAAHAYPALRCEVMAALVAVRRAQGEPVPTRRERRRGILE